MHDMPTHDSGMEQMTHATDSMDDMGSGMGDMHMEVRGCRDGDLSLEISLRFLQYVSKEKNRVICESAFQK
jgi:hypothetical protein